MLHPLSLTPSIRHTLDEIMIGSAPPAGARTGPPTGLRFTTDIIGMVIFVLMLGTYFMVRL